MDQGAERKRLIIFTDIGDTIIDESTEVYKVPGGVVDHAECIPGAKETMLYLYEKGYSIVMVADGFTQSFHNTMGQNGLSHIFSEWVTSEEVGAEKPSAAMFETAMKRMGLAESDKARIIMVGNNVERDMAGAKRFGIRSVQLRWSKRHPFEPKTPDEVPDYVISTPNELLPLVEKLEYELQ